MKHSITALCSLLLLCVAHAQDKLPAFGKIDKADLEMKICDFDPDAAAYCLMDIGEVQYIFAIGQVYVQTNHRVRLKVLKEKGIEQGDIKIPYISKNRYEEISNIAGFSYNLDDAGNIVTNKLEKAQIYDKNVNENYSQISFALPNVKVGTVVEYQYRSYKKTIGNIEDWNFQQDIPVRYSAYNLLIPEYFEFTYMATRRQPIDIVKPKNDNDGVWYIMRNVPSLQDEPLVAGKKNYYQRLNFQLSSITPPGEVTIHRTSTWPKLTEELLKDDEEFGGQLRKNIPKTADLDARLKTAKSATEKIQCIYKYVQSNMEWNDYHGIYSTGIKQAWDKKTGSMADINLLLANLLKDADIEAYPMLVSTKDNGKVITTYPLLSQFNAVMVYAVADGRIFIMNAADKLNCFKLIPYDVQTTEGFVVDTKKGGWVTLTNTNEKLKHNIALHIDVSADGNLKGEAYVNSIDYGRNVRLNTYKKGQIKSVFETKDGININMDSIEVKNVDDDTLAFEQKVNFSGSLQTSGEYSFLSYNLFTGLGKNPFVSDKRQTDIDFNYAQNYTIQGAYFIPDNFEFEELPKNMRMIMPDTSISISRMFQKNDNVLNFRIIIDFKRPVYSADEYEDIKEFYKKLFAVLNEKIVLKKKA